MSNRLLYFNKGLRSSIEKVHNVTPFMNCSESGLPQILYSVPSCDYLFKTQTRKPENEIKLLYLCALEMCR